MEIITDRERERGGGERGKNEVGDSENESCKLKKKGELQKKEL